MSNYRWDSTAPAEPFRDWHREWTASLYSTDVDLIEYTYTDGTPEAVGLFEYKHFHATAATPKDAQLLIQARLATAAGLPAFYVRYTGASSDGYCRSFLVYPMNGEAEATGIDYTGSLLSEQAFVGFLQRLRHNSTYSLEAYSTAVPPPDTEWPADEPPYIHHTDIG